MSQTKRFRHMARGLAGGKFGFGTVGGYGKLGPTTKATLYIGGKTGLTTMRGVPEGQTIPKAKVMKSVFGTRAAQIGEAVSGTTTLAEGRYKGKPEASYKVEFFPDESLPEFKRNIRALAEEVASDLGQREIYVELTTNGRKTETYTASPKEAPSALDQKAFCSWVRGHSVSAVRDPKDPCYAKPSKRERKRR